MKIKDNEPSKRLGKIEVSEMRKSLDYRTWKRKEHMHQVNYIPYGIPFRPSQKQRKIVDYIWVRTGDTSYEGGDVVILKGIDKQKKWQKIEMYVGYDTYKVYKIKFGNTLYLYRKHTDGRMYLSYYQSKWGLDKKKIPEEFRDIGVELVSYKLEAFVYKVETDKNKIDVKPYGADKDMSLVDVPYNPSFWLNLKTPTDTKFYKRIKKEIESTNGIPLAKQYSMTAKK